MGHTITNTLAKDESHGWRMLFPASLAMPHTASAGATSNSAVPWDIGAIGGFIASHLGVILPYSQALLAWEYGNCERNPSAPDSRHWRFNRERLRPYDQR